MTADDFNRDRDIWLRRVLSDRSLTPLAVPVAVDLALRFNRSTRDCFPHQRTIAEAIGASRNGVTKALLQLATSGYVEAGSPDGRRNGNTYRMVLNGSGHAPAGEHNGSGHAPAGEHNGSGHAPAGEHNGSGHAPAGEHNGSGHAPAGEHPMLPVGSTLCSRGGAPITSEGNFRKEPPAPPSSLSPVPRPTTTEAGADAAAPLSDHDLWGELANAAMWNVDDGSGIHDVQPIRDLMAEGLDLHRVILPAIGSRVPMLSKPLQTWRAGWLLDAIRAQVRNAATIAALVPSTAPTPSPALAVVAAPPPEPIKPAPPRNVPPPAKSAPPPQRARTPRPFDIDADEVPTEQVHRVGNRTIAASDLRLIVNDYFETGSWSDDMGPVPGAEGCLLPPTLSTWTPPSGEDPLIRLPGQMPKAEASVWTLVNWYRQGMPWPEFFGTEPGTPGCLLPQRFQDAALLGVRGSETSQ